MRTPSVAITNKIAPAGEVYRQSYSGSRLKELLEKKTGVNLDDCCNEQGIIDFNALCARGLSLLPKAEFTAILQKSIKKQFADNFLWRFLKRHFDLDIAIPGLTGYWSATALKCNLVVNVGHKAYADQISGLTTAPFTAMAYGTGAVAADVTDTALGAEVARAAATITSQTTDVAGDTAQWVHTFTAPGTQAITEEGILDNNTSGGKLLARNVFSAVNMVINDVLTFTHKIKS